MNQHAAPPEFAMSFTQEAVRLERRRGPGWQPLGQAEFSRHDMAATLGALCENAGGIPGESDMLLVIPDDQILYTTLTVPFGSDTASVIGRALEGSTPYGADELTFDWCPAENGDVETLRVAAVALRTLEEAEDFARAQGFRPSGFIGRPDDERFDGQPDFGLGRMSRPATARPFSQPDLSQARVTAPAIEIAGDEPAPPVIAAIIPHVVAVANSVEPASAPQPLPDPQNAAADPETDEEPRVIRYGATLPPRAAAVHDRAAAARALRAERADAAPGTGAVTGVIAARLRGLNIGRLPMMVGGLAALLLGGMLFFGGDIAQSVVEPSGQSETASQVPTETGALPDAPPPATASEIAATATIAADVAANAAPSAAPSPTPEAIAAATVLADRIAAPAPQAPAGADPLSQALAEAMADTPFQTGTGGAESAEQDTPRETGTADAATQAQTAAATQAVAAQAATSLRQSARPPRTAPQAASAPAAPDARPVLPGNPLPFEARNAPPATDLTGARPPARPAREGAASPAQTAPAQAPAAQPPATAPLRQAASAPTSAPTPQAQPGSARPPARPEEGSRAETEDPRPLTPDERADLTRQLRELRTAQAGADGVTEDERAVLTRLADARPTRRPTSVAAPAERALTEAVATPSADGLTGARPPERTTESRPASSDAAPQAAAVAASMRPPARPGDRKVPASASLSQDAVQNAIASAIEDSPANAGGVALTSLAASAKPPRRSGDAVASTASNAMAATAAPVAAVAATAPTAADLRSAAEAQAAQAAQRQADAELQAQAEERARRQAAADAAAEAQARAAAEARARAQAEAEARAAAARNQRYRPAEVDQEPEVVAAVPQNAIGNASASATVKDGIRLNSTQIIGTIGAGRASRALVRLSNGRVITLRLGDRINGGTITEIGDSRITYNRNGRLQALGVLNGQ